MTRSFTIGILFALLLAPSAASAQAADIFRGEVEAVLTEGRTAIDGTALSTDFQQLSVRIREGVRAGERVSVYNDSSLLFDEGDVLYIRSVVLNETETWTVVDPDRRWILLALGVLFVIVTVVAGGMAGFRSLIALLGSFLIIMFGLLPALLAGWPPVLTSTFFAAAMLIASMLITHGARRETFVALAGSGAALLVTVAIAEASVRLAQLSGFASDEAVYLNFQTGGTLDLTGLLLGGILIGVVGVLNDISVSQVHTVAELKSASPSLSRQEVFQKALNVGREHLGAVVNTLPLAYAGAALPLLLLFSTSEASFLFVINREVFASEVIRTLSGGIALSLSGAIATVLAVFVLVKGRRG
jgi:uncharacterized membrane protein